VKEHTDVVLIPQPTDDPNDPLNWPLWKKLAAFGGILWFVALDGWVTAGPAPALVILAKEFNKSPNAVNTGFVSWCIFTIGVCVLSPP
jgi:hypothetical protein